MSADWLNGDLTPTGGTADKAAVMAKYRLQLHEYRRQVGPFWLAQAAAAKRGGAHEQQQYGALPAVPN